MKKKYIFQRYGLYDPDTFWNNNPKRMEQKILELAFNYSEYHIYRYVELRKIQNKNKIYQYNHEEALNIIQNLREIEKKIEHFLTDNSNFKNEDEKKKFSESVKGYFEKLLGKIPQGEITLDQVNEIYGNKTHIKEINPKLKRLKKYLEKVKDNMKSIYEEIYKNDKGSITINLKNKLS